MKHIVIFDLDGTLALNEHRRHYVSGEKKDFDSFNDACDMDEPNLPVIDVLRQFTESTAFVGGKEYRIHILSGREGRPSVEEKTIQWIKTHIGFSYVHAIRLRPHGDYTPDHILKKRWLHEIGKENVFCAFDDRQKVVDMWRAEGITCFQVAPGNF